MSDRQGTQDLRAVQEISAEGSAKTSRQRKDRLPRAREIVGPDGLRYYTRSDLKEEFRISGHTVLKWAALGLPIVQLPGMSTGLIRNDHLFEFLAARAIPHVKTERVKAHRAKRKGPTEGT